MEWVIVFFFLSGIPILTILLLLTTLTILFRIFSKKMEINAGKVPKTTIWEMFFSARTITINEVLLTLQRATTGTIAEHPMGSPVTTNWLDQLIFEPATIQPPSLSRQSKTKTQVILGSKAAKPLKLRMPVMVAPMGYGIGLNLTAKISLAQTSTLVGTATSSGEGPFLPEERFYADRWILQSSRSTWAHQRSTIQLADMIEIQIGQGSELGSGTIKPLSSVPKRLRRIWGRPSPIQIHGGLPIPLRRWVEKIRKMNPGVPLAVKLPATDHIEQDLLKLIALKIDIVTIDGSEAASAGSPAVLSDHYGIPTAIGVYRAHQWLVNQGLRHQIDIVASGGIRGAADIGKLIALGANATAVGSILLIAMSHGKVSAGFPWHSPTSLVFAKGKAKSSTKLSISNAVEQATNWFTATQKELMLMCQTLGVDSIGSVSRDHLRATTPIASQVFAVEYIGTPKRPSELSNVLHLLYENYALLRDILEYQHQLVSKINLDTQKI